MPRLKNKVTFTILIGLLVVTFGFASFSLGFPGQDGECGVCHTTPDVLTLTSDAAGTIDAEVGTPFDLEVYSTGYTESDDLYAISLQAGWADNDQFSFTAIEVQDGSTEDTNPTQNEITTSFTFTPLTGGSYTIRVWVAAKDDLATSLDVPVSVSEGDTTPPTIDSPDDMLISLGDSLANVTWNPFDEEPDRYEVLDDGFTLESGSWNGSAITVNLGNFSTGVHTLILTVWDASDNDASDTVVVTVADGAPPTIEPASDVIYDEGDTGNSITWIPFDYQPSSYTVYGNDVIVKSGGWNSSTETISVSVDGLAIGVHNYTLKVTDTDANIVTDIVLVAVRDSVLPSIDSPSDFSYSEGSTGHSIIWSPSDPSPYRYEVFRNGTLVDLGTWNGDINVTVDGLPVGDFQYMIIIYDSDGFTTADSVLVTVYDDTSPTLDSPDDFSISEGSSGTILEWSPFDIQPQSYEIYRESVSVKSGPWNSSQETITISLDGLSLGVYNFTAVVIDQFGLDAVDTVSVTVFDGTLPVIPSPNNLYYAEGQGSGYNITWDPSDMHPVSYTILENETTVKSGLWNSTGESIAVMVDSLSISLYRYTLVVTDIAGNSTSDEVLVTVYDTNLPYVNHPSDQIVALGSVGNVISWHPLDLNPSTFVVYRDGTPIESGSWNSSAETITVSIDGLSLNTYMFTINVTDGDANIASDSILVTVSDLSAPTVDGPDDFQYNEGENAGSISWDAWDSDPDHYRIYRNGAIVRNNPWISTGQMLSTGASGLPIGVHNFTIWLLDDYGNTATDTVWVTVVDGTSPVVDNPLDQEYSEGDVVGVIKWNITDNHPSIYYVFWEGLLISSGAWITTNQMIEIDILGLSAGEFSYTILAYDETGNSISDTVSVTVLDSTAPMIFTFVDTTVLENAIGAQIVWTLTDYYPLSYEVFIEDVLTFSGAWNASWETISVSLDGLSLGDYNYTLRVFDDSANSATNIVIVTVYDGDAPTIDELDDFSFGEGETGVSITWNPSDLHPSRYVIFSNGSIIKSGLWNSSSESIAVTLDGLPFGVNEIIIWVYDGDDNFATDTVLVTVTDITPPTIDSPVDIEYTEGDTGSTITWTPSDLHPSTYDVYRDDIVVSSEMWLASSIEVSVDGLSVGEYNYTIVVVDVGGNTASDQVFVEVLEQESSTSVTHSGTTTPVVTTSTTPSEPTTPVQPTLPPLPPSALGSWGIIIITWVGVFVAFAVVFEVLHRKEIL